MNHHPDSEWLEQYAAGALSFGPALCVAVHAAMCPTCRLHIGTIQQLGGALLAEIGSAPVEGTLLDQIFAKLDSQTDPRSDEGVVVQEAPVHADIPAPLRCLVPHGLEQLRWSRVLPSLRVAPLDAGDPVYKVALHRIGPGGTVAQHDHRGSELTLVLRGAFSDEAGVYEAGDFLVREPKQPHRPMATQNTECICISALAAPVRFTGPVMRWLNPFLN